VNIFDYIDKYGNTTFEEKEFNEVDNLIFCSLSYLNFTYTSVNVNNHTIEYLGREYLKIHNFKDIKKLGIPQKNGYKVLRKVVNKKRYRDVLLHNYVYSADITKQFSAMMFKISDDLEYICFEGTDELVSGWKEDFELSYHFPIPSQKDAIKYANKYIKITGPDVIIGGHSKGGNLALVAAMYTKQLKQFRIKKVYSNDGPGLRTNEFKSGEYRRIKRKFVHFVPDYSPVGIILRNDIMDFVKTDKKSVLSHAIVYWQIEDDHVVRTTQSKKTEKLQAYLLNWLKTHTDKEKEHIVKTVFGVFEQNGIRAFTELINVINIKNVLSNIMNIDDETKDMLIDLFKYAIIDKKE